MRPSAVASMLTLVATGLASRAEAQRAADLERFYSAPSLAGTAPRGMTWSPDSRRLAFLWTPHGTNFVEVHVVTPARRDAPKHVPTCAPPAAAPSSASDGTPLGYTAWRSQRAALAAELDPGVTSTVWLADGRHLLATCRGELWLADAEAASGARRLTRAADGAVRGVAVVPAPDGGAPRIAFIRRGDVWTATLAGDSLADPRRLTTLAREAAGVEAIAWSPDGARVLVLDVDRSGIRQRGIPDYLGEETAMPLVRRAMPGEPSEVRRLGVVAASGGEVSWLPVTTDRFDVLHGWQWSPDGQRVLVDVSDVFVKHRRLLVAEWPSGAAPTASRLTIVAEERDSANVSAEWQAAWGPDGRTLVFTSDRADDYHVWAIDARRAAPRRVTQGTHAVFGFAVTPRGLVVTTNAGRPEERHAWLATLDGRPPQRLTTTPGTHTLVPSPDGRWGADLHSSDTMPPDLYLVEIARPAAPPQRVTTSPRPEFAEYRFAAARYVTFPSRADGATLHGRLLLPPGRRPGARIPLIIGSAYSNTVRNQWGGRNAHPLWGLDQVLLERGFAILAVDVAGSSGHGTAFRRRIRLDYGGIDVEDLQSGVEWAVREGIADASRVGIWGSSYGGLLTTMALFTKPDVFHAGVAGAPATNVWHALTGEQRVMLRPQEHMAEYADASSHTKADGLRGSLMLIHGMRDVVVLYKDSAWLTQYLLQLGRDVELVTLPDAGHGWDLEGIAQTRYAFRRLVAFFERTLLAR